MAKLPPVRPPPKPGQKPAPLPTPDGFMTTKAKLSLAETALALRDEQIDAQVVLYKADLGTNPELDAITAQVVAELQDLQQAARHIGSVPPGGDDRAQREIALIQTLKEMLGRIFRADRLSTVIERKLGEVAKRFARVFFESELHDKIRGGNDEAKAMRYSEQALWHALSRVEDQVLEILDGFQYTHVNVHETAREHFLLGVKELRNDFLARTTPELNVLVTYLNEVLTSFFTNELPPVLGELAWQVVKAARLADAKTIGGYKISARAFPEFRQAFERHFLERLVPFTEDEMLRRVRESASQFRSETLRFVADPAIFSELCGVVCDAVYDMLYNDGFLDLPVDWRARLSAG